MNLFERLDAVADRWNVLRHPFYERWECGALSRDEVAYYAGEYRHAVTALAGLAASASDADHAAEEAAHVAVWDDFAAELDADLDREPRTETAACVEAWSGTGVEGAAALFAIESAQPEVSRTKLEGLTRWYDFEPHSKGTRYFELHAERDHEHAELSRRVLERALPEDEDRIVAAAERALRANWELLDGVEQFAGARS
ncbi:MAG: iron-containing redox enzyme family protein [Actinobacteria bacterium]|nr:iron-containing redox enzyme family protein [Actinomycetota bacterium]